MPFEQKGHRYNNFKITQKKYTEKLIQMAEVFTEPSTLHLTQLLVP